MNFKGKLIISLFSLGVILFALTNTTFAVTFEEVVRELRCPTGMTMELRWCRASQSVAMKKEIRQMIDKGWSKQQILDYYVQKYGKKILSAPTKKGFDLVAWITPFAAVLLGGIALYFIIGSWVRQRRAFEKVGRRKEIEEINSKYALKLKEELERFEY